MHTTETIAKIRKCSARTVRRNAIRLEIGKKIGGMHLFTEEEKDMLVKAIQTGPGNPDMIAMRSKTKRNG